MRPICEQNVEPAPAACFSSKFRLRSNMVLSGALARVLAILSVFQPLGILRSFYTRVGEALEVVLAR
jgi:hypothetical protein